MFTGGDDVGAIVSDIGSFATRIGYAGDDLPRAYYPTAIGIQQSEGGEKKIDFDIANYKENLALENPVKNGEIVDWDLLEKTWEHAMTRYMKADIKESPVLIAEKPYNPPSARQQMTELMFETFDAPAVFISKDAVLECYACGRTTGLVIDIGASGTVLSPVCDGYVDTRGLNRSIVGGRLMDSYALSVMKKQALKLGSSTAMLPQFRVIKTVGADRSVLARPREIGLVHPIYDALMNLEMGRDLKESVCRVAESTLIETDTRFTNLPMTPYELPDGTIVDMGIERFRMTEMLFDPLLLDEGSMGNDMALLGLVFVCIYIYVYIWISIYIYIVSNLRIFACLYQSIL
jgi:actin-like protein 6A